MPLSEQSRAILEAIAKGHSYEQILVQELAWTYHDIFKAAAEALHANTSPVPHAGCSPAPEKSYDVTEIRQDHPHAYMKWSAEDDDRLRHLFESGATVEQIAATLQRQPGAIRSRLDKLNLRAPATVALPATPFA